MEPLQYFNHIPEIGLASILTRHFHTLRQEHVLVGKVARRVANKAKEENALHRFQNQVWTVKKTIYYDSSKKAEDFGEIVDQVGRGFWCLLKFRSSLRLKKTQQAALGHEGSHRPNEPATFSDSR